MTVLDIPGYSSFPGTGVSGGDCGYGWFLLGYFTLWTDMMVTFAFVSLVDFCGSIRPGLLAREFLGAR